jgi:hypothetical protein
MDKEELTKQEIIELQEKIMDFLGAGGYEVENEMIKALDNKTLDLSINQIKAILFLKTFNNKYLNQFIEDYLEYKKYNHSYSIILKGIELISLYNFFKGRLKFNINLSK